MKKILYIALILTLPQIAHAQTIEDIVMNLFGAGHLSAVAWLLEGIAYLGGIGLVIKGIFKLNDWNESKGRQVKLSVALIYLICGGMMLGLPTMIKVGMETATGTTSTQQFNGQYGGQY